jgi:hypothetical protein
MTLRLLAWLIWFFTATWVENAASLCKNRVMKGVRAMRKLGCLFLTVLFVAAFVVLPRTAVAQEESAQDQSAQGQEAQDQNVDPPSRVARLSYTQGSVSYQVSGDQNWVAADPNRPLTTNDNLWVDKDSLGEVHVGSTAIRMSSETGISILNLDDRTAQIQLAQGTIEVHLRDLEAGDAWEFDTPNLAFTLARAGEYRISTDPDSNTTIIVVREGEGSATGNGDSYDLAAGNEYTFTGTDQLAFNTQPQPAWDDFDNWCSSRDQLENNSESAQYVSRDVDGYYQLDSAGVWSEVPDYGPVWIPNNEPADWAPYRLGHWVWISPWGWTWVDDEPWGWAPFHYGRWVLVGAHWGWVPGPRVVRPVYAPALVGFVGGHGWGASVAFGGVAGVAWFPLGPRDVYVPGYHCSERYVQMVNVTNTRVVNVTRVTNVYNTVVINRQENHYTYEMNERAVVAVSRDTFVNARPVRSSTIRVNQEQLRNVRVVENAPLTPTRSSYVSSTAKVSTARPAVPLSQRPVMVKLPPPRTVRPTVYTNESAPFNQPRNQGNRNNNGFRPFTPPGRNAGTPGNQRPTGTLPPNERVNQPNQGFNPKENRGNQNQNGEYNAQPQNQPESHVRFAAPVRARDQNYDVHPPRNTSKPQPRTEKAPPKSESKPKSEGKPHGRG